MEKTISIRERLLIYGLPLALVLSLVLLARSAYFQLHPEVLSKAIILDLLLTLPILYFLLIRKTSISKMTVLSVFIAGIFIASKIIPEAHQSFLASYKFLIIGFIELGVLGTVLYHVYKTVRHYKAAKKQSLDFFVAIKEATNKVLPKMAATLFAYEITVFYYALFNWKTHQPLANEFTYHKKSGSISVQALLIFIILIETTAVHLLLAQWSPVAAWLLTFLSLYTGLQIFASMRSMPKRLIALEEAHLQLRYGFMQETRIPLSAIDSVELSRKALDKKDKLNRHLSLLGEIDGHNIILHLNTPQVLTGLYGIKREFKSLAIFVDEKERFRNELEQRINQPS